MPTPTLKKSRKHTVSCAVTGYTSTGVKFGIANPEGRSLLITGRWLEVTTVATAANTVDIGVAAAVGTGSDTLIDGLDVNAAVGIFSTNGTNGASQRRWGASEFVTLESKTGSITGLVGVLIIEYCYA